MTYLLDTHTLLWFLRSPSSLPQQIRELIEAEGSTLAISLATPWEISIKTGMGRLDAKDIEADLSVVVLDGPFVEVFRCTISVGLTPPMADCGHLEHVRAYQ